VRCDAASSARRGHLPGSAARSGETAQTFACGAAVAADPIARRLVMSQDLLQRVPAEALLLAGRPLAQLAGQDWSSKTPCCFALRRLPAERTSRKRSHLANSQSCTPVRRRFQLPQHSPRAAIFNCRQQLLCAEFTHLGHRLVHEFSCRHFVKKCPSPVAMIHGESKIGSNPHPIWWSPPPASRNPHPPEPKRAPV
jgi:hypothetical protein